LIGGVLGLHPLGTGTWLTPKNKPFLIYVLPLECVRSVSEGVGI